MDVPSSWAADQVSQTISAGIVPKALQSAYTQPTTQAEFCALAAELYETTKGSEITQRMTFSDTNDVNVEKVVALGVVNGAGDRAFDPDGLLTREQAATMLARISDAIGTPLLSGNPSFSDTAALSAWAVEAAGWVQAGGIMSGDETGTFALVGSYTREQSILTMLRLYQTLG